MRRLITAVAMLAGMVFGGTAQASYIYNLSAAIGGGFGGNGSIEFATASGNAVSPNVLGFNFNVTSGVGSPQSYGLSDINTINWAIDSSDILTLLLKTALKPFGSSGAQSGIVLNNTGTLIVAPCGGVGSFQSLSCVIQPSSSVSGGASALTAERVPESVPEPASLALLGLGLAGIGYQRRKRSA